MPWWGWLLIVVAVIVTPIKLKIFANLLRKNKEDDGRPA